MPIIIPNLHPAVVHFPIAFAITALGFSALVKVFPNSRLTEQWNVIGHWSLWLAALSAVVAVIFGLEAYNTVIHDDAGHLAMTIHRNWAIPTAMALVLLGLWDGWRHRATSTMSWATLIMLLAVCMAIGQTAWLGAETVYRHGIGVLSLPAAEDTSPAIAGESKTEPSASRHLHGNGHSHEHKH